MADSATGSRTSFKNRFSFLAAGLAAPRRTGAIAPSSRRLARAMADAADVSAAGRILEIGPGTGVVTKALLGRGVRERNLTLIELNRSFAKKLCEQYPWADVIAGDAFERLADMAEEGRQFDAVVSSLPLFCLPAGLRQLYQHRALDVLGPSGKLIQFTYNFKPPMVPENGVSADCSRRIWNNMPPAVVWTYRRADENVSFENGLRHSA